jgi:DNA-binding transcriptional LysR family regulator
MALVVPAGHRLAARAGVELSELQEETLVDHPTEWGTRMAIDRAFAAAGIQRTVAYEVNDTASVIEFIRHGLGVGVLPPSFVEGLDAVATVPIRRHAPQFELAVATPANRRLGAAARALLETIERQVSIAAPPGAVEPSKPIRASQAAPERSTATPTARPRAG